MIAMDFWRASEVIISGLGRCFNDIILFMAISSSIGSIEFVKDIFFILFFEIWLLYENFLII